MNRRYPPVAERASHHCEYRRALEAVFDLPFEVEHIIPPVRGGSDMESNRALACRSCNLHKGAHTDAVDPETWNSVTLFHPRHEHWDAHFRADTDSGVIAGLTPTGRATVSRLQMNPPSQLAARRQWLRLGLFPPG
jgi:hypothetical protein